MGEACVNFDNFDNCAAGLTCEWEIDGSTCVPLASTGDPCSGGSDCLSDYCVSTVGTCGAEYCDG